MRIALDGSPLTAPVGGISRYVGELSRALAEAFPDDRISLFSYRKLQPQQDLPENLEIAVSTGGLSKWWWSWGLARECARAGIEVFHGTNFEVPYLPARPSVLTIHDNSPWIDPGWGASVRVRRRTPFLVGLGLATMVITPSEAVRRDVIERFRLPAGRVAAVPLGVGPRFRPTAPPAGDPYFLWVGTIEPRKNLPRIVEAWREVKKLHPVRLVLAGRRRGDAPSIGEEPGLELRGEAPEAELPGLYSGAIACLYPSLHEGFGLPVLEAMACGSMVITSQDPALRELGGEAAVPAEAGDTGVWVRAMLAAIENSEWRCRQSEASRRRAARYSWRNTALGTREVYREAQRRFGG